MNENIFVLILLFSFLKSSIVSVINDVELRLFFSRANSFFSKKVHHSKATSTNLTSSTIFLFHFSHLSISGMIKIFLFPVEIFITRCSEYSSRCGTLNVSIVIYLVSNKTESSLSE